MTSTPYANLRYEIFDAPEPNAFPSGDVLGVPYASGQISTQCATYTGRDLMAGIKGTMVSTSLPAEPFTIPPSPTGARHVLVRVAARGDAIMLAIARNPEIVGGAIDPPAPEHLTTTGPDPSPYIEVTDKPILLALQPGDKIRARAQYG